MTEKIIMERKGGIQKENINKRIIRLERKKEGRAGKGRQITPRKK